MAFNLVFINETVERCQKVVGAGVVEDLPRDAGTTDSPRHQHSDFSNSIGTTAMRHTSRPAFASPLVRILNPKSRWPRAN